MFSLAADKWGLNLVVLSMTKSGFKLHQDVALAVNILEEWHMVLYCQLIELEAWDSFFLFLSSLPAAVAPWQGLERDGLYGPFQLKLFCDSRIMQNCSSWHQYLGYPSPNMLRDLQF